MKASGGAGWLLRSQQDGGADLVGQDTGRGGQHGMEFAACCTCGVLAWHCAAWSAAGSMPTAPSAHKTTLRASASDQILRPVPDQLMLDVFSPAGDLQSVICVTPRWFDGPLPESFTF